MNEPNTRLISGLNVAANPHCHIGENPLWNPIDRKLYWCDVPRARLYRFDPETRFTELIRDADNSLGGAFLGGFTIQQNGSLLLFLANGRIDRWTSTSSEILIAPHPTHDGMRFNDVIADPIGRVFCGTLSLDGSHSGNLFRLELDGTLTPVLSGVLCSNGLAFSRDGLHLYHTDSLRRSITRFDYDISSGALSRPIPWITTNEQDGMPDGITVDADDHLWSAQWGAGCVIRFDPSGQEQLRITLPVSHVSSITFGGEQMRTLFITTATTEHPHQHPLDGALFMAHSAAQGVPELPSRIA
ncbi:putative sugar lactone lactonase YvrE [Edaphobacter acidisoli]|uniref:Sugar lactone lactonase YvrE n=1 Tax=Edaphobacter acidisoli TaxID=2040573 RepID=A0A916VZ75_9BACT|nr:SMP-30/gluconolactonase/LRE family protein [Edaphobacter acidisoli]GGA54840.1 putative sugar lactone lactonase YvrE [Edaphobacter acidisoli]